MEGYTIKQLRNKVEDVEEYIGNVEASKLTDKDCEGVGALESKIKSGSRTIIKKVGSLGLWLLLLFNIVFLLQDYTTDFDDSKIVESIFYAGVFSFTRKEIRSMKDTVCILLITLGFSIDDLLTWKLGNIKKVSNKINMGFSRKTIGIELIAKHFSGFKNKSLALKKIDSLSDGIREQVKACYEKIMVEKEKRETEKKLAAEKKKELKKNTDGENKNEGETGEANGRPSRKRKRNQVSYEEGNLEEGPASKKVKGNRTIISVDFKNKYEEMKEKYETVNEKYEASQNVIKRLRYHIKINDKRVENWTSSLAMAMGEEENGKDGSETPQVPTWLEEMNEEGDSDNDSLLNEALEEIDTTQSSQGSLCKKLINMDVD